LSRAIRLNEVINHVDNTEEKGSYCILQLVAFYLKFSLTK